jgi:hypothetical protein
LFASWLEVTVWLAQAIRAKVSKCLDGGADGVKDAIMDLDNVYAPDDSAEATATLPPLNPEMLVACLQAKVDQVLHQVAQAINEDPSGCWEAATEERVLEFFSDLGQEALAQGLELRVCAAEAMVPRQRGASGNWAHKYRKMLASAGHWPPDDIHQESS